MNAEVRCGEALDVLRGLEAETVDSWAPLTTATQTTV